MSIQEQKVENPGYEVPNTDIQLQEKGQDTEKNLTLTIKLNGGYEYITQIWLFDYNKSVEVEPSTDTEASRLRHYKLAAGTYIIRTEINGIVEDNEIKLDTDKTYYAGNYDSHAIPLNVPKLYSSALLGGNMNYETSHEYYTDPAISISKKDTLGVYRDSGLRSGLFIFMRYPSADIYEKQFKGKEYWQKFSLFNAKRKIICKFPDHTETLSKSGHIGFSSSLPPGLYFLKYGGENAREIPIYVYEGWYTQFFMTVASEPLFGTIRIFLSPIRDFNPNDQYHLFIDICLNKIQNEDYHIDADLLQNIAYGKYDSPMLGLLGAYLYLKSKETKNDELFKRIVHNLRNKILANNEDAPDLWALNLLSYEHFNQTFTKNAQTSVEGTPMLRIAYDTIKRAAARHEWLVTEGSLNDLIAENQVFDSPYNTYTPIRTKQLKKITIGYPNDKGEGKYGDLSININDEFLSINPTTEMKPYGGESDIYNLQDALDKGGLTSNLSPFEFAKPRRIVTAQSKTSKREQLLSFLREPSKTGWIGCSIVNELLKNENVTSQAIAERINVPISTIQRLRNNFNI